MLDFWQKVIPDRQFYTSTLDYSFGGILTISSNIISIGDYALRSRNNQRFENQVFQNCNKLTTITIGPNLAYMSTNTFQGCSSLATINVIGDENCTTAKTLQAINPSYYNNATIVYNYIPPSGE